MSRKKTSIDDLEAPGGPDPGAEADPTGEAGLAGKLEGEAPAVASLPAGRHVLELLIAEIDEAGGSEAIAAAHGGRHLGTVIDPISRIARVEIDIR